MYKTYGKTLRRPKNTRKNSKQKMITFEKKLPDPSILDKDVVEFFIKVIYALFKTSLTFGP